MRELIEIDELELFVKSSKAYEEVDPDEHLEAKKILEIINSYKQNEKIKVK